MEEPIGSSIRGWAGSPGLSAVPDRRRKRRAAYRLISARETSAPTRARKGRLPDAVIEMDELKRRFASGHSGALRELYDLYAASVFAVSYRVLGNTTLAEEAVQQTFLKAWRSADRFDDSRDLAPWLHTIARRAAIDVYRRERRHRADEVHDDSVAALPPSIETTWAVWEVRRALHALPAAERAVLQATHYLGLTHQEAARWLDVPVGTIKSRAHRAYRRLAELLAHVEERSE